jgi:hypothetical protein
MQLIFFQLWKSKNTCSTFTSIFASTVTYNKITIINMKKITITHPLLLCFLALFMQSTSCRKENTAPTTPHTTAAGQVINTLDNRPVPYAQVFLLRSEKGCGGAWCDQQVATMRADSIGRYTFEFEWDDNYFYSVDAQAKNYFHIVTWPVNNKGKLNIVSIKQQPGGWVKVHVKNVKKNSKNITLSDLYETYSGDNVDTVTYGFFPVNERLIEQFTCGVKLKSNIDSGFNSSYNPVALDTALIEINY